MAVKPKGSLDRKQEGTGSLNYLESIQKNTQESGHPRHNGIAMQAHHLLTVSGVKKSDVANDLIDAGYNINWIGNVVFLPSTLKGACHLGIQPHRGDHTAIIKFFSGKDSLADDKHPLNYHTLVKSKVEKAIKALINGGCPNTKIVIKTMNNLSKEILDMIQNHPEKAPLTSIANFRFYNPESHFGCANETSVSIYKRKADAYEIEKNEEERKRKKNGMMCPKNRDHLGDQDEKQTISYPKPKGRYTLEVGK
jgi:hypothetical protein